MPQNIPIQGDDKDWKRAVDRTLSDLTRRIETLESLVRNLSRG